MVTQVEVRADHPTLASHFPGASVVPGSILQEMCTQTAACLLTEKHVPEEQRDALAIGVLMRIHDAKFRGFVRPPQVCHVTVELLSRASSAYRFKGEVRVEGSSAPIAKLHFTLANVELSRMHPDA
jgi:3-hydroxyacyl-[acyl-carrier-protein] dehydratase